MTDWLIAGKLTIIKTCVTILFTVLWTQDMAAMHVTWLKLTAHRPVPLFTLARKALLHAEPI